MSNLCSTQFNLPDLGFKDLAKAVPDEHIFDEEENTGRENEPHLSVLFGITENNPEAVRRLVKSHNVGPITITLGKTELFKNEKFNVLKVHVEGQDLHDLHDLIKENIPNEEKFPDYNPHVTLAYLKKGHGPAWEGDTRWEGKRLTLSNLLFSDPNRKKTQIPLIGNRMKKQSAFIPGGKDIMYGAGAGAVGAVLYDNYKRKKKKEDKKGEEDEKDKKDKKDITKKSQLALEKMALNTNLTHLKPLLKEVRNSGAKIVRETDEGLGWSPAAQAGKSTVKKKNSGNIFGNPIASLSKSKKPSGDRVLSGVGDSEIYIPKGGNPISKRLSNWSGSTGVKAAIAHELGHIKGLKSGIGKPLKDNKQAIYTIDNTHTKSRHLLSSERDASQRAMKILDDTGLNKNRKEVNKKLSSGFNTYKLYDLGRQYKNFREKGVSHKKILGKA